MGARAALARDFWMASGVVTISTRRMFAEHLEQINTSTANVRFSSCDQGYRPEFGVGKSLLGRTSNRLVKLSKVNSSNC